MVYLKDMYRAQEAFDQVVLEKTDLMYDELMMKLILGLQVELAECANEWRGFKFWSRDQKPRKGKMLEEYVDGLHLLLSIGLMLGYQYDPIALMKKYISIEERFSRLMSESWNLKDKDHFLFYQMYLADYLDLGKALGFRDHQIEMAFYQKGRVNYERQKTGY